MDRYLRHLQSDELRVDGSLGFGVVDRCVREAQHLLSVLYRDVISEVRGKVVEEAGVLRNLQACEAVAVDSPSVYAGQVGREDR